MRILVITNQYPRPGHETIASFNRQQFRALAAKNELRIVAPIPWQEIIKDRLSRRKNPRQYRNSDGIEVYHPTLYYIPRTLESRYGQFYQKSIGGLVRRVVDEFKPDVFLACWAHPDGWAAVQLAREMGLPVVIKVIGSDVLVLAKNARRRLRIAQALRQADGVVAVSRDLAEHVERLGTFPGSVHVVPEGIDRDLFRPGDQQVARAELGLPAEHKRILFVGNLLHTKGVAVLIEACRLLRSQGIRFQCDLVGHGRDAHRLRELVASDSLKEHVIFRGAVAHERLPAWFHACNLVALPSFSEGIPNVLREAMQCGRPFVATNVGGIPEISDPSFSRLVPLRDVPALAAAVAEMLASPPSVNAGVVRQCNLSWEESADLLAERLAASLPPRSQQPRVAIAQTLEPVAPSQRRDRRLRILVITNQYPRLAHDGIASFNRQQFRELAKIHDVRVVSPLPWPEVLGDWLRFDGRVRRYKNRDRIWVHNPTFFYVPKFGKRYHGHFFCRSIQSLVRRLVDDFRPDVLLGCWAYPDGWATVQLAREFGLPVVVKVHGSDVLVVPRDKSRRLQVAEGLATADRVVAVSQDLANHVVQFGVPQENVHVVRNGIDTEMFFPGDRSAARRKLGIPSTNGMVLFIGNLLFSKGIGVLVEACGLLKQRRVDFNCYLVGDARHWNEVKRLTRLIRTHDLGDQVTLVGQVPQARLRDWYSASNVVTLPSFSEGIPNVLQEATACGRPFVATNVGGIPEIAHPSLSRLVAVGDAEALASALAEMLARNTLDTGELARCESISWQRSAEMLAEQLEYVVAARSSDGDRRGFSEDMVAVAPRPVGINQS